MGCLLYFVLPVYFELATWYATVFLVVALLACTIVTLAPLSRRKAVEAASQLAPIGPGLSDETAQLDPLDEASEKVQEDS